VELEVAGDLVKEPAEVFAPLGKFFVLLQFQQLNKITIYIVIILKVNSAFILIIIQTKSNDLRATFNFN
jgi:hypothetical protein